MLVRRLLLVIISLVIGYAATFGIVLLLQTTPAEFWRGPEEPLHIPYFLLTGFFIACALAIWLDKFMKTEILPK
jgi:hypothetical protein